jgi:hypothetical protein
MNKEFIFWGSKKERSWFCEEYFNGNNNLRYWTFQIALNLLSQRSKDPIIIETGCQREKDDFGAGMSTSIFARYIHEYGGMLLVCDNNERHLNIAKECVGDLGGDNVEYWLGDSVEFLTKYNGRCNLLYLDSYDYPYGDMLNKYGGREDIDKAMELLDTKTDAEIVEEFRDVVIPCQKHCLNEFLGVESNLQENSIVLIDDNSLPGGGKSRMLKDYLADNGWTCLMDYQQSLWVRSI